MFGYSTRRNPPVIGGEVARRLRKGTVDNAIVKCEPTRYPPQYKRGYNRYEGSTVRYKGGEYEVVGCGTGPRFRAEAGALSEGVYALRNRQTGNTLFVPKRRMRDTMYHSKGESFDNLRKSTREAKAAVKEVKKTAKKAEAAVEKLEQAVAKAKAKPKSAAKPKRAKKSNPSEAAIARRMRQLFGR